MMAILYGHRPLPTVAYQQLKRSWWAFGAPFAACHGPIMRRMLRAPVDAVQDQHPHPFPEATSWHAQRIRTSVHGRAIAAATSISESPPSSSMSATKKAAYGGSSPASASRDFHVRSGKLRLPDQQPPSLCHTSSCGSPPLT